VDLLVAQVLRGHHHDGAPDLGHARKLAHALEHDGVERGVCDRAAGEK
jgi:hypothetical protein